VGGGGGGEEERGSAKGKSATSGTGGISSQSAQRSGREDDEARRNLAALPLNSAITSDDEYEQGRDDLMQTESANPGEPSVNSSNVENKQ